MARRHHNSKSQAKRHARTHGFRQPHTGAQSGPVIVRKMTTEEMAAHLQTK